MTLDILNYNSGDNSVFYSKWSTLNPTTKILIAYEVDEYNKNK